MKTSVSEIVKDIYRISIAPTDGFEYNHFLIVDEQCMLIHTGGKQLFTTLLPLVEALIDVRKLCYIAFSHVESDECGSLNEWLKVAPNAIPIIGLVGRASVEDISDKAPQIVKNNEVIDLGKMKVQVLTTPHIPHGWEACMFYEQTHGVLFSSDLGAHPGINSLFTDQDVVSKILQFQDRAGFMPKGENLKMVVERLKLLEANYMAVMHGSTLNNDQLNQLFDALLET